MLKNNNDKNHELQDIFAHDTADLHEINELNIGKNCIMYKYIILCYAIGL